jgi:Terminase large subunit, T4likevirus-type, N-terminal
MTTVGSPHIQLKPPQWTVFTSDSRFRVLVAGRRFGKTFLSLVELCRAAWSPGRLAWYVAPTYKQAKRIAWKPLKLMTKPYWASPPNETDLRIDLISGGTICLRGADNYDSLRGDGLDFLILDEFASIAPEAWPEVLRPALADRRGRALFIGTPHGYDHFYDLYQAAQDKPDWATFQFTTEQGGNVSREELASATQELDESTYRQEFQASFENLAVGVVYYAFDRTKNVAPLGYNPDLPLFWSLDFNVNPMCSVIGQRSGDRVWILDELVLPDSNTPAACQEFMEWLARTRPHSFYAPQVHIYGDAAGNSRQSSASRTDWQIVSDFFKTQFCKVERRVTSSNPLIKDRANCVNAMLHNQAGQRRLLIDPKCKQLILDLERVRWRKDPHGNALTDLDKSDPARTHVSDALGYMIAYEFGMRGKAGDMRGSPPR